MADESQLHAGSTVEDAVASILRSVLPTALYSEIADCVRTVMRRETIAPFVGKRWVALSEREAAVIAREVGDVAAELVTTRRE